jgi:plastocyanin
MTPIRRTLPLLATATAAVVLVAGCGSSSKNTSSNPYATPTTPSTSSTPSTPAGASAAGPAVAAASVKIKSYAFSPASVTVKVGGKITFTNEDGTAHTATADDGTSFDSGSLGHRQSKTITFTKAGTFSYHCAFHAFMTGKVVVSS